MEYRLDAENTIRLNNYASAYGIRFHLELHLGGNCQAWCFYPDDETGQDHYKEGDWVGWICDHNQIPLTMDTPVECGYGPWNEGSSSATYAECKNVYEAVDLIASWHAMRVGNHPEPGLHCDDDGWYFYHDVDTPDARRFETEYQALYAAIKNDEMT